MNINIKEQQKVKKLIEGIRELASVYAPYDSERSRLRSAIDRVQSELLFNLSRHDADWLAKRRKAYAEEKVRAKRMAKQRAAWERRQARQAKKASK